MAEPLLTDDPVITQRFRVLDALFFIEDVTLDSAWRGHGLGQAIVDRLVEKASYGHEAAVVLCPYPVPDTNLTDVEITLACMRLEHYWEEAGFRRLGSFCWERGLRVR